jgi:hypothetical protein
VMFGMPSVLLPVCRRLLMASTRRAWLRRGCDRR